MHWDHKMRYIRDLPDGTKLKQMFRANNTNLNEELGKIEFIFSDKTGTLTQNNMILSKFLIGLDEFDEINNPGCVANVLKTGYLPNKTKANDNQLENIVLFLRTLAVAHDVLPASDEKGGYIYESSSPDETALLNAAASNSFVLVNRSKAATTIHTPVVYKGVGIMGYDVGNPTSNNIPNVEDYEPLHILEFSSDRKRMSAIFRTSGNKIHIYTKGADNIMLKRLDSDSKVNPPEIIKGAIDSLNRFSEQGLRTLVVAFKEISPSDYLIFKEKYEAAERNLVDREDSITIACDLVENNLKYLGCTAIEDKLQDKVPETIDYLLKCDIKFWLLTGDKQETAINIGYSSKMLEKTMKIHIISGLDLESVLKETKEATELISHSTCISNGLIINGESLGHILNSSNNIEFLNLCIKCKSVICCRVTPLQKAQVVLLVKSNIKCITLAIGDGANDVSYQVIM